MTAELQDIFDQLTELSTSLQKEFEFLSSSTNPNQKILAAKKRQQRSVTDMRFKIDELINSDGVKKRELAELFKEFREINSALPY